MMKKLKIYNLMEIIMMNCINYWTNNQRKTNSYRKIKFNKQIF